MHLLLLAAVLVATGSLSLPGWAFSTDEGAPVAQALILEEHGRWEEPASAYRDIDPNGIARPYINADVGDDGVAPYVKHPLYVLPARLLVPFGDTAVGVGMQLLSIVGALVAAAAAGRLARIIDPGLEVLSIWLTGVASPLLFDAHLLMAHTLAAAAVGWVAVGVLAPGRPWATPALASLGGAVAVGLRSEAPLALVAILIGTLAARAGSRPRAVAVAALAGGLAMRLAESAFAREVLGSEGGRVGVPARSGAFLPDRLEGAATTLLQPGYGDARANVLLSLMLALVVVSAAAVRLNRPRVATWSLAAAAGVVLVRAFMGAAGAVPGLLVAAPLLTGGWLLTPGVRQPGPRRFLAVAAGATALAILATQYARGGGIEWGWRFAAIALPLAMPLAAAGLRRGVESLRAGHRTFGVASAVVLSVAIAWLAMGALVGPRSRAQELSGVIREVAPSEEGSVVISLQPHLPRILWRDLDRHRWLTPEEGELDDLLAVPALPSEVVLVTPARDQRLEGWSADVSVRSVNGLWVTRLRRA